MQDTGKKLFIRTFGCQMNEADSDEMYLALAQAGYRLTDDMEDADAVLLNTCTVREHAEHRALSLVGRLKFWKQRRTGRLIIVAGCAAQRLGSELRRRFPHVDLAAGAKDLDRFAELFAFAADTGAKAFPVAQRNAPLVAYSTIMRGCSHACAYCIVPAVRGPGVSRDPGEILAEIKDKAARGAREIVLLGQTVNSYRHAGGETDFPALLRKAHAIESIQRIRFISPHPGYINEDFAETLERFPKIARHMHLPVQSGSDRILALMKRGYTRAGLLEKISLLKTRVPDIAVSTDFIVGFPSEQETDFADTLSLVRECGFSFAYCFKYSPRAGTPAAEMPEQPDGITLEDRLARLLAEVKETAARRFEEQVGTVQETLFETPDKGRTSTNYWVRTKSQQTPGTLVKTKITGLQGNTLLADL
ncbi:MAG: tRNA (N6-isopentenyl adenosine(37)-C2)-methylthiotransferase MiaB [Elusimicrobiaceae bacterium]|nr:tRNA (N6-isopentenyl adenosine(37)-C2)-methylthiotransferase MiaB [Elusimicrobiaceae bacterium]